ncbi:MAG: hypothetical protein CM15mV11_0120 [Caudoviricetes sp.]|nr:MAG: hypothetical protein CM15mV11_0120 [Caudoviricetes sp.]
MGGIDTCTDYSVNGTTITYATAPRTKIPSDDAINTYITYLDGFVENQIVPLIIFLTPLVKVRHNLE